VTIADIGPRDGGGQSGDSQSKAKIFISYSRKDTVFVGRLEAALKVRGFEALVDRDDPVALKDWSKGIAPFEDWWKEIQRLIVQADTVVFVISPDSIASSVCNDELAFVGSLNKRLAPILYRPMPVEAVPESLRRLQWIDFQDEQQFESIVARLAVTLETNIEWVRKHTELGEQARRWAAAGRPGPRGLLLRSPSLDEAERWIASRPEGAPAPTEETQAFIAESRRGTTRRRNILTGSLGAGLVVALVLAGLALWQRGIAVEQRKIAEARQIATLAELATIERLRSNVGTGLRLGVRAVRLALALNPTGAETLAPADALSVSVWEAGWQFMLPGNDRVVSSAAFSPDGRRIVTASADHTAHIWDAATGKESAVLRGHEDIVTSAAFSPDGTRIVTASDDDTARIWDATTVSNPLNLNVRLPSVASYHGPARTAIFLCGKTALYYSRKYATPLFAGIIYRLRA
jgi:hypothetical protein